MARIKRVQIEDIVDYFDELEDPRTDINIKHPFVSVVVIAMMAVLAGANGPTAIARWAKLNFFSRRCRCLMAFPAKMCFGRYFLCSNP